ncbi:NRDE protein-domain-containing protein [Collybia nuda]|uniref:NRDE protein-domain-containing protein n=1 Tax=Collybia nuda TaxID=64659 RepID=A0A9P5YBD7_9AGAR|nr:NRDE protein-domain-containing protein [Collybia nuda]
MCIALWALDHQEYALILCSNRDEFLSRPTLDAHFHNFENGPGSFPGNVLSGRDEQAGGTWFGVNRAGRVALLTNITEPFKAFKSSRGYLTSSFLLSDSSHPLEDQVGGVIPQDAQFAGFNLLLLAPASRPDEPLRFASSFVTNHGAGGPVTSRPLSSREHICGCVSNAVDGEIPVWPKVQHATQEFDAVLQTLSPDATEPELTARLFDILAWRSPEFVSERSHLRRTIHVAPFPITLESASSVGSNSYGTRLSTILLIKTNGEALFIERDMWKLVDGEPVKADPSLQRVFRFQVKLQ